MPSANPIPLAACGLMTVAEAARRHGRSVSAIQRWIQAGRLRPIHVPAGGGRVLYLLRFADVDAFTPPPRGAPPGNQRARKVSAPKIAWKISTSQDPGNFFPES